MILIGVLMIADMVLLVLWSDEQSFAWYGIWSYVNYGITYLVEGAYILHAFFLVRRYEKKMLAPLFLRLEVFVLPFLGGLLLTFIFPAAFDALGFSLGILLTWKSMKNRYRYLDADTGFYNKAYLELLTDNASKKHYPGGSALFFRTEDGIGRLAGLLREEQPTDTILIRRDEQTILLLSGTRLRKALVLLQRRIEGLYQEQGEGSLHSAYLIREKEEQIEAFKVRIEQCIVSEQSNCGLSLLKPAIILRATIS